MAWVSVIEPCSVYRGERWCDSRHLGCYVNGSSDGEMRQALCMGLVYLISGSSPLAPKWQLAAGGRMTDDQINCHVRSSLWEPEGNIIVRRECSKCEQLGGHGTWIRRGDNGRRARQGDECRDFGVVQGNQS